MKKLIIFGENQFAELLYCYVKEIGEQEIIAFTVERKFKVNNRLCDIEIVDFENLDKMYDTGDTEVLIAVGYRSMNTIRKTIFSKVRNKGFKIASFMHRTAIISTKNVGEGNIFLENVVVQPLVKIGEGNIFFSNSNISHNSVIGNFNYFSPSVSLAGDTVVENNCFFGNNVTGKNNIVIKEKSLIGAASYIYEDTEKNGVYVPHKSKKLKYSSQEIKIV